VSVKGKVAIVTGGNSGIGMSIVLELARQGANLAN
jgi:glucose 1-dehydrogenase